MIHSTALIQIMTLWIRGSFNVIIARIVPSTLIHEVVSPSRDLFPKSLNGDILMLSELFESERALLKHQLWEDFLNWKTIQSLFLLHNSYLMYRCICEGDYQRVGERCVTPLLPECTESCPSGYSKCKGLRCYKKCGDDGGDCPSGLFCING